MSERKVVKAVRGQRTVDGAGVHLVRVLGPSTVKEFDPWLMLDSFDSEEPKDYINGFPPHPHRGIETITYLIQGEMTHGDSLGNQGVIRDGESQWMTAGSGIIHEEMPKASERMLGVQLWLNLPQKEKMAVPRYFTITKEMIGEVDTSFGHVRVIAGEYDGTKGVAPAYVQATLLDILVEAGEEARIPVAKSDNAFVFFIENEGIIDQVTYEVKTAVLMQDGDEIRVQAPSDKATRLLVCAGQPLHEEVAWGGPIVMNTREELKEAFRELDEETFIKHEAVGK